MKNTFVKLAFFNLVFILVVTFPVSGGKAQSLKSDLKVVSLSPHITEIIYRLKADQFLVGRTDFCNFPPATSKIDKVGGYLNIDYEKIVALHPDVVFQFPNDENRRKLESLGFRVVSVPNETIQEILNSIRLIGNQLGLDERAEQVIQGITDTLNFVRHLQPDRSLSALLVIGRQPGSLAHLYLAGASTYLSELWSLCGGVNAFSDVPHRYFPVNLEDILNRPIEVVLEFHPDWELTPDREQSEKSVWTTLAFPDKNRVFIFTEQYFVIPGPRITQIALVFSHIIHHLSAGSK